MPHSSESSIFTRECLARTSYSNSVCPSVRPTVLVSCPGTDSSPGEIETPGFHLMIESLVSCDQISWRCVRRFPSNEGIKEGYPTVRNHYFIAINSSSVRTVADRHRLLTLLTSYPAVLTSMTLNDHEPPK